MGTKKPGEGFLSYKGAMIPEKDLNFMRRPHLWPCYPVLPLRRHPKEIQDINLAPLGCLVSYAGPRVYHVLMFQIPDEGDWEALKELPQTKYDTLEDILLAGWRVD